MLNRCPLTEVAVPVEPAPPPVPEVDVALMFPPVELPPLVVLPVVLSGSCFVSHSTHHVVENPFILLSTSPGRGTSPIYFLHSRAERPFSNRTFSSVFLANASSSASSAALVPARAFVFPDSTAAASEVAMW